MRRASGIKIQVPAMSIVGRLGGTGQAQTIPLSTLGPMLQAMGMIQPPAAGVQAGQLPATATNDSASAGNLGEYKSMIVLIASEVSLTNATFANVAALSLTAGDWDVWAELWLDVAATTTVSSVKASVATANNAHPTVPADGTAMTQVFPSATTAQELYIPIAPCRVSLASTTSRYLNVTASFAVSTLAAYGKICARRVR